jgi:hypothetical protein
MLKAEPPDSINITIFNDNSLPQQQETEQYMDHNDTENRTSPGSKYIDLLRAKVLDEIIERIEQKMDMNAADILDAARVKHTQLKKDGAMSMIILKPICLLFLFEVYLATQGKI